ncbi:FecR domain-containing protein [Pedobacter sp. KR3-3]|uniref:FecR domain-containing protein n=1 Tax=Pedobacter albus TaxID=3113905 RepID=A0ABU7IC06_9SPHI|nr:FecR domain-containing protein [Pedobacter sp. KR3-3]MEE1947020.1 FecR domain-containing protein [Pedobacter sp. KR3-3]
MNDEILIKFLLKETNEEENRQVNEWLVADAENAKYFAQLEKIWQASGNIAPKEEPDVEVAWLKFKAKADVLPTQPAPVVKPLKTSNKSWLRIAAVLVLAIGAWTAYTLLRPAYIELSPSNMVSNQVLPDGSELTINKNTAISYARNFESNRSVKLLHGEAFFKVAHDKNRPFVIDVGQVSVQVVGTSFNIKHLDQNQTEVVVESGIVKVKLGQEEVRLVKGERIFIGPATQQLAKQQSKDQLYSYYRTGIFVSNNTPLHELVDILNEAYGSHVVVNDDVKDLPFTAPLKYGSLTKNLDIICDALDLEVVPHQQQLVLSKKQK